MKNTFLKKSVGFLLIMVMFASLFTCLMAVPASASASDTKMLHAKATATGLKFGWRSDSSSPIAKGTKYRLSLDWENITNAPLGSSTLGIYCYVGSWKNIFNNSTYYSEWNVSSYPINHGDHYDIDFTLKSSLSECREFVLYFGDINNNISSMEFNTANWVLYTRDASENLTNTGKTFTFPVTIRGASDGAMNSYISSYTTTDRGQLWANNTSSSYARSFVDMPSGYFDVIGGSLQSNLVTFNGVADTYGRFEYTKGWATIPAGNYRFEMDCKIASGTPTIQVGNDVDGTLISGYQTNYTAAYDDVDYKYVITFTISSAWGGNLGARIGNYGTNAVFTCANPTLYLLDANGDPTGSNLINTFSALHYCRSRTGNKWNMKGSAYTCETPIPTHHFTREQDLVTFSAGNSWASMLYLKGWSTLTAGNYRFEMDCKVDYGTPYVHINQRGSSEIAEMTDIVKTYDRVNYKYVLTFTLTGDWTEVLGVRVGSWNSYAGTSFTCAHPTLYKLDANGDPTGSSLINTFSEKYYAASGTPSNPTSERDVWFRAADSISYSKIPSGAFESSGERGVHFPDVAQNSQVLAYKDNYLHLDTGTYRFTIDQADTLSDKGTVNLYYGTDIPIGNAITPTRDTYIGNSRTVEFTISSASGITGFGIFIGNYSSNHVDAYFKKPALYKVENGVMTGINLIKPINTQTLVLRVGLGRASIENGKWSTINYNTGYTEEFDFFTNLSTGPMSKFNAPTFKSHSLTLNDDISINFTVDLSGLNAAQLNSCAMDFAIANDKTYTQTIDKAENLGDGLYRFTCNLTSVQMMETVTPTLTYTGASLIGDAFSVRNYVDYIVANHHDVKLRELVKAINDYGYYSQQYLSEQHAELTFTDVSRIGTAYTASDHSAALSAVSGNAMVKNITGSAVSKVQYNINFGTAISINVKLFKDQTITTSATVAGDVIVKNHDLGSYEEVRILELPITSLGDTITITGAGTSNATAYSVSLSGLSYVRAILNSGSSTTNAKNAVTALYKYYQAALAYAG